MSTSSFLSMQLAVAYRRCVRLIASSARQSYNAEVSIQKRASSADCSDGLSMLIDEITEGTSPFSKREKRTKESGDVDHLRHARNMDMLNDACKKLKRPFSSYTAAAILNKLSLLNFKNGSNESGLLAFSGIEKGLMAEIGSALRGKLPAEVTLRSLSSFLSLGIDKGKIFDSLLVSLREHLSSDPSAVPLSHLIQFTVAIRSCNYKLSDETQTLLNDLIQLKTSEVVTPSEAISLMVNVNIPNDAWYESLLERTKELLPLMSIGELVSLTANLAERKKRRSDVLPLIAATFAANPTPLTASQLAVLSQSVEKLGSTDGRLLRRLAADVVSNAFAIKKWCDLSSIVCAFARMHFSHNGAWSALTTWINANYKNATSEELSRVITACTVCDMGHLVPDASKHLTEILDIQKSRSAGVWLSTIYALAICGTLTPKLAETVLRREFIEQFSKIELLAARIFNLSRIAQIQAYAQCVLRDKYRGPVINLQEILPPSKEVNDAASLGKYGKKEAFDVTNFCNILYKIAPLDSHSLGPFLSSDGFFIDAIVQIDQKHRFVPIENFDGKKNATLALIYLSPKQMTITCADNEERRLLGPISLGLKLLERRGMIPVTFTSDEIQSKKLLTQKIDHLRTKLQSAASGNAR